MTRASLAFALLASLAGATARANDDPPWRSLFDGTSTEGWKMVGPGQLVLEDGLLRTEGGMGLLWYTKEKLGDCVIRVVFKTSSPVSNSGVFVRMGEEPKDEWTGVHKGYEIQILDRTDPYHRTGAVYSMSPSKDPTTNPPGEWNTMDITLDGPIIRVAVNGTLVNEFDPSKPVPERTKDWEPERGPRPEAGYIGLQNHDDYASDTHVWFTQVSVQPLPKK
jgi:hypothetical protein